MKNNIVIAVLSVILVALVAAIVLVGAGIIDFGITERTEVPNDDQTEDTAEIIEQPSDLPVSVSPVHEDNVETDNLPEQSNPAAELLESMNLEEKVYQLFIVTPEELTGVSSATIAGEATREALSKKPVGGLVYFANNILNPEQITAMIDASQSYSEIPLFIGVDEEGGMVSRIGSNPEMEASTFDNMWVYGQNGDTSAVYDIGATIAEDLLKFGFNLNFAPIADVLSNPNNTAIGRRAFSADPYVAGEMAAAFVNGSQDMGVIATLKHFPGHGATDADSHHGMAISERTLEELKNGEFIPFKIGIDAGAGMVMVAHISVPEVTNDYTPADLSYMMVTQLLREELGFEGVVITDSQSMSAITDYYTSAEAALQALQAGVDIILMPQDLTAAAQGIIDAVNEGILTIERIDESVMRILTLKYEYGII